MIVVHLEVAEANEFVRKHHRHHVPVLNHRFSIGLEREGDIVGVAIVGRPVARAIDYLSVVEVTRLCTDGTKNACSMLYGASTRAAKELGYHRIQTYILASEPATSLRAAGWELESEVSGRSWNCQARPRDDKHPTIDKMKWVKILRPGARVGQYPSIARTDLPAEDLLWAVE